MATTLKELANGWKIESENSLTAPYLKAPEGHRYNLERDKEGKLHLHSSRSPILFAPLLELYEAFEDWETGKPGINLPESWEWEKVPPLNVWAAVNRTDTEDFLCCYITDSGDLFSTAVPHEIVDAVIKMYRSRRYRFLVTEEQAIERKAMEDMVHKIRDKPIDAPVRTKFDSIREGTTV